MALACNINIILEYFYLVDFLCQFVVYCYLASFGILIQTAEESFRCLCAGPQEQ